MNVVIQFFASYYPTGFVILCGIVALAVFRRSWPTSFKLLAIFTAIYLIGDTIGALMSFNHLKNHFVYNILYSLQFLVIALFYYLHLSRIALKKAILLFFVLFPVFVLVNTLWFQGFYDLQTYSYVFGGCFAILLSVGYLWQLYTSEETHSIFRDPVLWFSLAWLVNFAFTVPYFGMLNFLMINFPDFAYVYYLLVIDISDCLRSILLTIGFIWAAKMK